MLDESSVKKILLRKFNFSNYDLDLLDKFVLKLLEFNQKYNLISKSTEKSIWERHILDSAQIIKFIMFESGFSLSDFGTGAGFPGIIIAIFNKNPNFHVKLYEKSPVKCDFLKDVIKSLDVQAKINPGDYLKYEINSNYLTFRAFKKLDKLIDISRENHKKSHKMIILKGKNAQKEINKALNKVSFNYKLHNSITDIESKIIVSDVKK